MFTETPAVKVTAAFADLLGSATLVAVTVTVCAPAILAGAVYRPVEEIVPLCGLILQVTTLLTAFATVAVNCCVAAAPSCIVEGERVTPTGDKVIVAVKRFAPFVFVAAVSTTVSTAEIVAGAVYRPADDIVPTFFESVHVTAPPLRAAVNCCCIEGPSVTVPGLSEPPPAAASMPCTPASNETARTVVSRSAFARGSQQKAVVALGLLTPCAPDSVKGLPRTPSPKKLM